MQTTSRIFDDVARLASGALGTAQGVKTELDNLLHQRLERMMAKMDLVPRDEFDAIKEMVINLGATVDAQAAQIKDLEAKLKTTASKAKSTSKSTKKS